MTCSCCNQKGHNIRTCPLKKNPPTYPPVCVEFAGGPLPEDLVEKKTIKIKIKKKKKKKKSASRSSPKKTRNRDEKIPNESWLIPNDVLLALEREAEASRDSRQGPKQFLKALYASSEYRRGVGEKTKRGSIAKNWKTDGEYLCPSLHKADNIYQCLGKRVWISDHNGGVAGTWPGVSGATPLPEHARCQAITEFSGGRCQRSVGSDGCHCTQHFKMI